MIAMLLIIISIIFDQVTKIAVRDNMSIGESINIIGNFIQFTYVRNPGIVFGIPVQNARLFTILSVIASIGVAVYLVTHWKDGYGIRISLSLILGGAIGNLIDRILYRQVVDFIDIGIGHLRWPVFNLADSFVVIGMGILFYTAFISNREKKKEVILDE